MDDRKFAVRCDARSDGQLQVRTHALSMTVSQLIKRNEVANCGNRFLLFAKRAETAYSPPRSSSVIQIGTQNLQIVCIRSRVPEQGNAAQTLEIDPKSTHV